MTVYLDTMALLLEGDEPVQGSQPVFSQHFSCVCYSDWETAGAGLQTQRHLWPCSPSTRPSLDTEPPSLHFRSNSNLVTLYGKKKEKTWVKTAHCSAFSGVFVCMSKCFGLRVTTMVRCVLFLFPNQAARI